MEISHDTSLHIVSARENQLSATLRYILTQEGINIISTFVPKQLEGRGIASALTQSLYDYAISQNLNITSSCSYGVAWLKKHQ